MMMYKKYREQIKKMDDEELLDEFDENCAITHDDFLPSEALNHGEDTRAWNKLEIIREAILGRMKKKPRFTIFRT